MINAICKAGKQSLRDAKERKIQNRVSQMKVRDNFKFLTGHVKDATLSSNNYYNKDNEIITRFIKNGKPISVTAVGETCLVVLKIKGDGGDYLSLISDAEYLELTSLK